MKNHVESIKYLIKDKNFDKAEISMLEFISTYGGNIVVWDYLGQLLMIKKNYKHAYLVLKHGYENSSKRGKAAKSTLYHLVLCCRKLKYEDDIAIYEGQLQFIEKI
jgi:TolA-binding protein